MSLARCEVCNAVFDCAFRGETCPHDSFERPEEGTASFKKWLLRLLPLSFFGLFGCELIDSFDYSTVATADGGEDAGDLSLPSDLSMSDLMPVFDLQSLLDLMPLLDMMALPDLAPFLDMTPPVPVFDPATQTGAPAVQSDVDRMGCATVTCHQAYAPLLFPATTGALLHQNYLNFVAETDGATTSKVLSRLLAADASSHSGGKFFAATTDVTYQRWLRWIQFGAPER